MTEAKETFTIVVLNNTMYKIPDAHIDTRMRKCLELAHEAQESDSKYLWCYPSENESDAEEKKGECERRNNMYVEANEFVLGGTYLKKRKKGVSKKKYLVKGPATCNISHVYCWNNV